jgi:diguanylate cyclase (GGDEF)-like protein
MSFRTRLTSFFVLIVVIPMIAVGFLVFRLISDSQLGKWNARINGLVGVAHSLYASESAASSRDAETIAHLIAGSTQSALSANISRLSGQLGLARVVVAGGGRTLVDVGDRSAVAPGAATLIRAGRPPLTITVSEISAGEYVRELTAPGVLVAVHQGTTTLGASNARAARLSAPTINQTRIGGVAYRGQTETLPGFGRPVSVTILSSSAGASSGSLTGSRVLAAAFIIAVLLLAFSFSVMASRGLQGQLSRFLQAARRLAAGDFSSPIQTEGHDEFAALGQEFNNMSEQLERRLEELSLERARLREAITRIGQTFASNLDRTALLELALKTAVDAVQASAGRLSVRAADDQPLTEAVREGSLAGVEEEVLAAERAALGAERVAESGGEGKWVASVAMAPIEPGGRTLGLITVVSRERELSAADREVLRSLAAQATLALENVELHLQVSRQAVTDELTGLANHGRFQELLDLEIEQVRRYRHPLGLIMLDVDNFKSINDTYGHQQGDVVLKRVAKVLADTSREADFPARYGGEEMALILPHTDLEGAYAIAERIRTGIEAARVARNDGEGVLRVTASLGVASLTDGSKDDLIADADGALYEAKRTGKNRTVIAPVRAPNLSGAE